MASAEERETLELFRGSCAHFSSLLLPLNPDQFQAVVGHHAEMEAVVQSINETFHQVSAQRHCAATGAAFGALHPVELQATYCAHAKGTEATFLGWARSCWQRLVWVGAPVGWPFNGEGEEQPALSRLQGAGRG